MTHFDYTLPILQKLEKTKCAKSTWLNFIQIDLAHFVFLKVLKNVVKMCHMDNVLKRLVYSTTLNQQFLLLISLIIMKNSLIVVHNMKHQKYPKS